MMAQGGATAARGGELNVGWFNLVDLLVDEDNFRLEPSTDQPAAIKAMLRRQGRKLVVLAEDIIANGLSRGEFIWVAPDSRRGQRGRFVVCEGNRRVTTLKLMNEPALASGTKWEGEFKKLGEQFRKSPTLQLRGVLYPSVDAARPDVYRRHTNDQDGRGLEDWDPFAQDRANKAAGNRRTLSMVVMEHLTTTTIEALAEGMQLRERTTNADRLLSTFSSKFAKDYGIRFRATKPYGVDLGTDPDLSEDVLWALLRASDVSVDLIKTEGLRLGVIQDALAEAQSRATSAQHADADADISDDAAEPSDQPGQRDMKAGGDSERGADGAGAGGTGAETSGGRSGGRTRDPVDRKTLAPTDKASLLTVTGVRLPKLYLECKTCDVSQRPNAASMLLRVFLELSCEAYLIHFKVRPPGNRPHWGSYGIRLDDKIAKVLHVLDHDKSDRRLKDAWSGIGQDLAQVHSTMSLHRAMHDLSHALDATEIKTAWQRWHPLFERIHDEIAKG